MQKCPFYMGGIGETLKNTPRLFEDKDYTGQVMRVGCQFIATTIDN